MNTVSRTAAVAGSVIGFAQAVILLVNAFGWAEITGEQGAAITAVITACVSVWASRMVNDQIGVALNTLPPVEAVFPNAEHAPTI